MTAKEIKEVLKLHKEYLIGNSQGERANLWRANLWGANLWRADLRGADLRGANLWRADLRGADLRGADLREVDLREADLREADLREANLWGADLRGANLWEVNLREANLWEVNLREANLRGATGIIYIQSQYKYESYGYYLKDKKRVTLGCYDRTIEEWDSDFWNNEKEFPKDSSQGKNRFMIYTFIKEWLIANEERSKE